MYREVFWFPYFLHFEPCLDTLSLRPDVISAMNILPFFFVAGRNTKRREFFTKRGRMFIGLMTSDRRNHLLFWVAGRNHPAVPVPGRDPGRPATSLQKHAVVPRRARIQGSFTFVSLYSRLESYREQEAVHPLPCLVNCFVPREPP